MTTYQIFLASSSELEAERREFEIFISRLNNRFVEKDIYLKLVIWEDFIDAMSKTRLQDEYNKSIMECDIFIMLFWTKVGIYTEEEFATAFGQFQEKGNPLIYTYFKNSTPLQIPSDEDQKSLINFQERLKNLGHFQTKFKNIEGLNLHFNLQLDKLFQKGFLPIRPLTETVIQLLSIVPAKPPIHIPRQIFKKDDVSKISLFGARESCNLLEELKQFSSIVLLGDAGMGKSDELKCFCNELKDTEEWIPIYKSLSDKKYLTDLPELPKEVEDRTVLVLDGLDESNIQESKQAIESFQSYHSKVKILVSCRSNAYSNTLQDFKVYFLGKLAYPEIKKYVQWKLGPFSETFLDYWRNKYPWNQNQLLDNPFFLIRICEYVKDKGNKTPDKLGDVFEYLIEKSFDRRLKDLSHYGSGELTETRKTYHQLLEKLAFIMECHGENTISKDELTQIIPDKSQRDELIGKSSLIELEGDNWRFAHNNFQEYLAAKVLSNAQSFDDIKKALAAKPDYKRLKWTWTNSLSFLMGLWNDDVPMKTQLLKWLAENDIEPLIKICSFERDRISPLIREHIFKLEFENCKKENLVVGSHYYSYWDMAEFGESANTIRYLIEELRTADNTQTVKGNALVLLKAMRRNFLIDKTEKAKLKALLLQNIYDFEQNTPENRHHAIEALFHLYGKIEQGEAIKMVKTFFDADHALERSSAYSIIEKQNLQIQFMESLIGRIRDLNDHNWKQEKVRYLDEDWRIENCFKSLDDDKAIVYFFEKFPKIVENRWDDRHDTLNLMLDKLDS